MFHVVYKWLHVIFSAGRKHNIFKLSYIMSYMLLFIQNLKFLNCFVYSKVSCYLYRRYILKHKNRVTCHKSRVTCYIFKKKQNIFNVFNLF